MFVLTTLGYILFFTILASIVSLLLVSVLLVKKSFLQKRSFSLVAFAAGALLATGFLETFPQAVELGGSDIYLWVTLSIAGFFIIERLFLSLHHHEDEEHPEQMRMPTGLLLFGDALHNFIDGVSIAAGFLVNPVLGMVTSAAIFMHEIPHELADFGILLHKGWERRKIILFSIATGITSVLGGLLAYFFAESFSPLTPILLAITTGNFIYLAATDLLPEIHHHSKKSPATVQILFFLLGIFLIWLLRFFEH